jgi:Flp pilus assembly pilin Flp
VAVRFSRFRLIPRMDSLDEGRRPAMKGFELVSRFLSEDGGQDIVEYALLAGFLGIAGMLTLRALSDDVLATYTSWLDPASGTPSLWAPNEP